MKKKLYLFLLICTSMQAQFVTGGYPINVNQAPYQASLQLSNGHRCGCSILNNQWLLTAAHCVTGYSSNAFTIKTGLTLLSTPTSNTNTYTSQQVVVHPNYNSTTMENDIALIKISGSISYNVDTSPITLATPSENLSLTGQSTRVSGWGWTTTGTGTSSDQLMMVNVPIITNSDANAQLDITSPGHPNVSSNMIATGSVGGVRQGACHGDSGGPLVVTTSAGTTKQIGTVSWGVPTCVGGSNSPSIFAKVENYIPWINSYIIPPPVVYSLYGSNPVCPAPSQSFVGITPTPPAGSTITWSTTPNLIVSSTLPPSTPNTSQVLVQSTLAAGVYQTGTVTATINGTSTASRTLDVGQKPFSFYSQKTPTTAFTEYCDQTYHYVSIDIINSDTTYNYSYTFANFITGISNPGITYTQTNPNRFVFKIPLNKIMSGANPIFGFSVGTTGACGTTPYMIYGQVVVLASCNGMRSAKTQSETASVEAETIYTIYPNPVGDVLNIALNNTTSKSALLNKAAAVLYDLNGQPLDQVTITDNKATLDVSKFKKGIYVLKIDRGGSFESHQIIIK